MGDVQLEDAGKSVKLLRLNRPAKLNALADATVRDIGVLLDEVAASKATRVLIVSGAGRGFCAGLDLAVATDAPGSDEGEADAWMRRQELYAGVVTRLRALPQPVIAAVNGVAAGAGLSLALACDVRIAARSARFNCAFIRIGLSSCDLGVSYLLPRCIGTARAFELMLTGRMIDADEAGRIGLVSEVVDDARLLARAVELASMIVANSAFGVWMTKRGMWANLEAGSLQAALELENRTQMLARTTGDMDRAVRARFADKG